MEISVTGVPEDCAATARAAIHAVLGPWSGDGLIIVAHRSSDGRWSVMAFDGADLALLKNGLEDRVLRALQQAPSNPEG
jgi:hypothetical protein